MTEERRTNDDEVLAYFGLEQQKVKHSEVVLAEGPEQDLQKEDYITGSICSITTEYVVVQGFVARKYDPPEYV